MRNENEVDVLIEAFFDEFYYNFSSYATFRGIHRYDYKLSSFSQNDLTSFKQFLNDLISDIKVIEEKYKKERLNDIRTLKKIVFNTLNFLDSGLENSPNLLIEDAVIGITSVALSQSRPMNIRSRNFTSRINHLKELPKYFRSYVHSISKLESRAILREIDYLEEFIDQYASFLLTKSDTEKKENLKTGRVEVIEALNELRGIVKSLPQRDSLNITNRLVLYNLENEDYLDLKNYLEENLSSISENIIKKARELKIANPYYETLKETVTSKTIISEERILEVVNLLRSVLRKLFAGLDYNFEIKTLSKDSNVISFLESHLLNVIISGEFDTKKSVLITLQAEDNFNFVIYSLLNTFVGKSYTNFYRQNNKSKRKYLINPVLYEGLSVYLKRLAFDEIKLNFEKQFELYYYYCEYLYTLKAYLMNEIYFRKWDTIKVENFISEDKILIDREEFLDSLIYSGEKSFLGMQGVYLINDLRRYDKKAKTSEFLTKLIQNSFYPFSVIYRMLR